MLTVKDGTFWRVSLNSKFNFEKHALLEVIPDVKYDRFKEDSYINKRSS